MRLSKQKAKGTRFEREVVGYLRAELGDERPERLALHGAKDIGDVGHICCHGYEGIAECKCHDRVTKGLVESWQAQTTDERDNGNADFGLLVVSLKGRGVGQSLVFLTLRDLARVALQVQIAPGWEDVADDHWACVTLQEACSLMRGLVE